MSGIFPVMHRTARGLLALVCAFAVAPGDAFANLRSALTAAQTQTPPPATDQSRIPADQLDSLVSPIALHPDPLLAQILAASTYPLELVQLQQWLTKNAGLKDKALLDSVSKQPWDASIQAMAGLPDIVKWLTDDIQWTTDLGNAFLAQQSDVMDAVQRMRAKATMKGNLTSTQQQTVETRVVENKQVIVIEQADPQVVYVPSYNPAVVYGPPVYPYPPIYYPSPGYYAAGAAISFGVGVAMGAIASGGWGWGAGWGRNDININTNNNFNRNANINGGNRVANGGSWQHNPRNRGGAPYRDAATANRFRGTARGDSLANRQAGARQQLGQQGGNLRSGAVGTTGAGRVAGSGAAAGRAGGGAVADRAGGGVGSRGRAPGSGAGTVGARGGADSIGGRDLSRGAGGSGAFGGGSGGFNGSAARDASRRGSSSVSSERGSRSSGGVNRGGGSRSSGGGRSRGGGGGGGRSRGGGGGRR